MLPLINRPLSSFYYRVFIKYCVFSLKFCDFSELCQFCYSAGFLPAWCVYTHWHRGKQSSEYLKKNTLYVYSFDSSFPVFENRDFRVGGLWRRRRRYLVAEDRLGAFLAAGRRGRQANRHFYLIIWSSSWSCLYIRYMIMYVNVYMYINLLYAFMEHGGVS